MSYFRAMLTNNLLVLKKTLLGLAVSWTVLIAFSCLVTFNELPSLGVSDADKYVHVTFHFVFTLLWGFYSSLKQNEIKMPKIIRLVIISIFYGIVIEILQQAFTTTRHADIMDVLANITGAILALILFVLIQKQKANKL